MEKFTEKSCDPGGALAAAPHTDRREGVRKPCRVRAQLDIGAQGTLVGKTLDLGPQGVSLLLPRALPPGCTGDLHFSIFVKGNLEAIRARVEVANCVFLSTDVRVGFRVVGLDPASRRALDLLLR